MTNGNTKGGSGRPDAPVEASRADRIMGRRPAASKQSATTDTRGTQGRSTTQSWRPPTAAGSNGNGTGGNGQSAKGSGSSVPAAKDPARKGTTGGDTAASNAPSASARAADAPAKSTPPPAKADQPTAPAARSKGPAEATPGKGTADRSDQSAPHRSAGTAVTTGAAATAVPRTANRAGDAATAPAARSGSPAAAPSSAGADKGENRTPAKPRSGNTAASATSASTFGAARRTRKARLRLSRLDPWSVMKTSFLFSLAALVVLFVATIAIYGVLQTAGLFNAVNEVFALVVTSQNDPNPFNITDILSLERVAGGALVIGALNVVIFTALATLFAFLYNISATLLGGLEVTLAED